MQNDKIFTPPKIVKKMLDEVGYNGQQLVHSTILEPSFGEGAFLIEIVSRMLSYAEENNISDNDIYKMLSNIHGVEIERAYYNKTIESLNMMLQKRGLQYSWHNLVCCDLLDYRPPVRFDYICANPPYIRIHDLKSDSRKKIETKCKFGSGNTDLYVAFYELCINMLNQNTGKLIFIAPNSYFKNSSQKSFRKYLSENNMVESLTDYGKVMVFKGILTYTAITYLRMGRSKDDLTTYTFMKTEDDALYTVKTNLQAFGNAPWSVLSPIQQEKLNEILKRPVKIKDLCDVQYGLATNADHIYIIPKERAEEFEPDILRPVVKASTLNDENKIIFPYVWNQKEKRYDLIKEDVLKEQYPKTYRYLNANKEILMKRDLEKDALWYQYGRSQGIQSSYQKKIAIKHIISENSVICDFKSLGEDPIVYSGIFLVIKNEKNREYIEAALRSQEFHDYLLMVGKNMAGNYKNVNAKAIKNYGLK